MKILVTGAGGYIGGGLASAFSADGHTVYGMYRSERPVPEHISPIFHDLSVPVPELPDIDVVVHCAAHTRLEEDLSAAPFIRDNVHAMFHLIDAAITAKVKLFINPSTLSVYGNIVSSPLSEHTQFVSPDLYGTTKYLAEQILAEKRNLLTAVTIRLPGVVGPNYFRPWLGRAVKSMFSNAPITFTNGTGLFNNVVDLVELKRFIEHLMYSETLPEPLVNLAAADPIPLRSVLELAVSAARSSSSLIEREAKTPSFYIDTTRQSESFGYAAASTGEIVERYVRENIK